VKATFALRPESSGFPDLRSAGSKLQIKSNIIIGIAGHFKPHKRAA
jgi:hypothetical protein